MAKEDIKLAIKQLQEVVLLERTFESAAVCGFKYIFY
jgi:hypothetical protein